MRRHTWAAAAIAGALVVLAGCDGAGENGDGPSTTPDGGSGASAETGPGATSDLSAPASDAVAGPDTTDASLLPTRAEESAVPARVADGVIPPTNRWYSGLVFGDQPFVAFPAPLSFNSTDGGFAWGVPRVGVAVDGNSIVSPASSDVTVAIDGASGLPVATAADTTSVTLAYGDASVSLAAGSPMVGVTATADMSFTVSPAPVPAGDGVWTMESGERTYGISAANATVDGSTVTLSSGDHAQMFAVPDGGDPAAVAAATGAPIDGVDVTYAVDDESATTSLAYAPEDEPTLVAVPRERAEGLDCELGTYPSVNGEMAACTASTVAWSVPTVEPDLGLDLDGVTEEQRAEIVAALESEAQAEPTFPADTYFGAKALHRHAMLVTVADALGETALADEFAGVLSDELLTWADPAGCERRSERCFEYDEQLRGVVGLEAAFGSEEFNDHHFHYGYLLNAAAVALERDPSLEDGLAPVMDLVAADIASPADAESFPTLRAFDPFAGHSWASGFSPFGDGNNQESSSEAVLAWNGVAAWAQARGDESLTHTARWTLSAEANAAVTRWLRPDLEGFEEYQHDIVALQWGGKREYATWFSAEPSAMLGIELIPMAPVQQHLAPEDEEAVATALRSIEAAAPGGYEVPFGDYLLMYQALAGPEQAAAAWDEATALPDSGIDDGNSRAAMLAWIAAAQ
ncbi:glycosyl hydrolase [Demequina muriae]|uniref:glucan endo-1,3-beta-D-glucosidase n=1 Tax=Demequina muriae TaxID=3051664 RepID=A0ABT8GH64_9MICO|nr:glycosyl hydrolase [Demequina sp. EGI L300058]MDN4480777.1 glycosyl hydrolase [Demequina sp. EGI L300058]